MADADPQHFFYLNKLQGEMGKYDPSCDRLHPELRKESSHYALTETHYFGFNVPEANIDGLCYVIHRPNLGVLEGGVQAFQGFKRDMIASEMFDFRQYMSDKDFIEGDLQSFKLDSGYSFEVIEPTRKFRLRYEDPKRGNSIDIIATAASAPIVWPNGRHFEQTMKNEGTVALRGKRYAVNSYHVRDRSWEAARLERPEPLPAMAWLFGVLDENLSFQCTFMDHPDLHPEWEDHFAPHLDRALMGGWIWKDGEGAYLKSARNRVQRNPTSLYPETIEVDIVDTKGRHIKVHGVVKAAAPMISYAHLRGVFCLVRWETDDGQVMWGECQDGQFTDYVHTMMAQAQP